MVQWRAWRNLARPVVGSEADSAPGKGHCLGTAPEGDGGRGGQGTTAREKGTEMTADPGGAVDASTGNGWAEGHDFDHRAGQKASGSFRHPSPKAEAEGLSGHRARSK